MLAPTPGNAGADIGIMPIAGRVRAELWRIFARRAPGVERTSESRAAAGKPTSRSGSLDVDL